MSYWVEVEVLGVPPDLRHGLHVRVGSLLGAKVF